MIPYVLASLGLPFGSVDLINHLWQSSVVAAALLAILHFGQTHLSARTRRRLAGLGLVKFALPAALFLPLFQTSAGSGSWVELPAWRVIETPTSFTPASAFLELDRARSLSAPIFAVWGSGFLVLLGGWLWRARRLHRRLLTAATPLSAEMQRRVSAAARRGQFALPARCLAVAPTEAPGVCGAICPILVLPRDLETTVAPRELEAVLLHELIHLHRRDTLWNAVQFLLVSAFWFHPLAWLLFRRWSVETEKSCDERVIEITGDAATYADGIVKIVAHTLGLPRLGLAGAATPPIAARVKNVLAYSRHRHRPLTQLAFLAAGGLMIVLSSHAGTIAAASRATPAERPPRPAPEQPLPVRQETLVAPAVPPAAPAPSLPSPNATVAPSLQPEMPAPRPEPSPLAERRMIFHSTTETETEASAPPAPRFIAIDSPAIQQPLQFAPAAPAPAPEVIASTPSIAASSPADLRATMALLQTPEPPPEVSISKVYDISQLTQLPIARFQAQPSYPFSLRQAGVSGQVVVAFVVNQRGDVQDARALSASHPDFEDAAVKAVSRWKFRPGRIGGKAVNTRMKVPMIFSISTDR